jgi:hypothetical protein
VETKAEPEMVETVLPDSTTTGVDQAGAGVSMTVTAPDEVVTVWVTGLGR